MRDGAIARLRDALKTRSTNYTRGFEEWKMASPKTAYWFKGAAMALDEVISDLAKLEGRMLDPYVIREECLKHHGNRGYGRDSNKCKGCKFCPEEDAFLCLTEICFKEQPRYWHPEKLEEALEKGRGLTNPWGVEKVRYIEDWDKDRTERYKRHSRRRKSYMRRRNDSRATTGLVKVVSS